VVFGARDWRCDIHDGPVRMRSYNAFIVQSLAVISLRITCLDDAVS
jgi:hypothetical protein